MRLSLSFQARQPGVPFSGSMLAGPKRAVLTAWAKIFLMENTEDVCLNLPLRSLLHCNISMAWALCTCSNYLYAQFRNLLASHC